MPRYFFHVRHANTLVIDDEGQVFEDLKAANTEARDGTRDLAIEYIRSDKILSGHAIEVADESGAIHLTIPLTFVAK